MAESKTLTLRAWTQRGTDDQQSLSSLISRINSQEGSFRNAHEYNEDELKDEDAAALSGSDDAGSTSTEGEPKSQREKVLAAREEIIKFGNQALTESSHTLDLISLLLTSHNPKQASFTLSPFIKQTLPNGCFGTETVDPLKVSDNQAKQNDLVSFGWKLQSLSTAADSLLRAASDLEQEMEKEAKYWDQVLSVKAKGWSVFRLPGPRRTLGVRYGSLESPPEFRDKAVAALRRADDGGINLDLGQNAVRGSLRVRVKSRGQYVASTEAPLRVEDTPEASLLQARNEMFDGELYHEMHREARTLTNRGVRCLTEGIHIPILQDITLVVDTINLDDMQLDTSLKPDDAYSQIPNLAATAFRILLSYSHRQHYRSRTEVPAPMKQRKKPRLLPAILQPVLFHVEHRQALVELQVHLSATAKVLSSAGITFKIGAPEGSLNLARLLESDTKQNVSQLIGSLMRNLCSPLESTLMVETGSNEMTVNLSVRTHPNGTEYLVSHRTGAHGSSIGIIPHEAHFYDMRHVSDHILQLVTLDLVSTISSKYDKWQACEPDEGRLRTELTRNGDAESIEILLAKDSLRMKWSATDQVAGEGREVKWPSEANDAAVKSFLEEAEIMSNIRSTISNF